MDAHLPSNPNEPDDEDFVALLAEQRARVKDFSARRHSLQSLEADLAARMERMATSLADLQEGAVARESDSARQLTDAERLRGEVAEKLAGIQERETRLEALGAKLSDERGHMVARARRIAARFKTQRQAWREERSRAQALENGALSAEISRLQEQLAAAQAEHQRNSESAQSMSAALSAAQAEVERLRPLNEELAAVNRSLADAQADREQLKAACEVQKTTVRSIETQLAERVAECERLAASAATLESSLLQATAERDRTVAEYAELAAARDALTAQHATAAREREQANQERDAVAAERQQIAAERDALAANLAALREQSLKLEADHGAAVAECERVVTQREQLAADCNRLTTERDRAIADAGTLKRDFDQARTALADSSAQAQVVEELQGKLREAEELRRQLEDRVTESTRQAGDRATALQEATEKHGALLAAAHAEVAKLQEQLSKHQTAEQKASQERASLSGRCEELDAALAQVKAEFDRETQQASLRVKTLESDLAGARAANGAENVAQQQVAERLAAAEAELREAMASRCALEAELQAAREETTRVSAALAKASSDGGARDVLQAERDALSSRCEELSSRCVHLAEELEKSPASLGGDDELREKVQSLEKRYSMAMDDLKEGKTRIADLEQKLADARRSGGVAPIASGGGLDWEAQKRRMLAMLEEFDDGDAEQANDRLTIQGTLEITDSVVAEKDQEIQELRKLLEEQSSNIGNVAVGAAAIAQLVESDEVIQHERERARQLQSEWEAKMSTAEVEISVERAKLARERAELEEKLRNLEERAAHVGPQTPTAQNAPAKEQKRGRWLERLGLKDNPPG